MHDDIYLTSQPGMIPEDEQPNLLFYGVLHVNGTIQVKRYYSWEDYKEAGDSSFTLLTTFPFEANNHAEAERIATTKIVEVVKVTIARLG